MTLVFEDGKWVGANKMTLAASSYLCAAAWQKKASAPTDLYEGNSEQYFGGIPPPGTMLNAQNFSATYYTSREVWDPHPSPYGLGGHIKAGQETREGCSKVRSDLWIPILSPMFDQSRNNLFTGKCYLSFGLQRHL